MSKKIEVPHIREVEKLPEIPVLDELIFNKSDGYFYLGVENGKGVKKHGSSMEKTSVCK